MPYIKSELTLELDLSSYSIANNLVPSSWKITHTKPTHVRGFNDDVIY